MTIPLDSTPSRGDRIRYRHIAGETVVLDQENRQILVLNQVGGRMLDLFDGRASLADVAQTLVEEFDESYEVIALDVQTFTSELLQKGLVTLGGET